MTDVRHHEKRIELDFLVAITLAKLDWERTGESLLVTGGGLPLKDDLRWMMVQGLKCLGGNTIVWKVKKSAIVAN